jgi:hypothetical protein
LKLIDALLRASLSALALSAAQTGGSNRRRGRVDLHIACTFLCCFVFDVAQCMNIESTVESIRIFASELVRREYVAIYTLYILYTVYICTEPSLVSVVCVLYFCVSVSAFQVLIGQVKCYIAYCMYSRGRIL